MEPGECSQAKQEIDPWPSPVAMKPSLQKVEFDANEYHAWAKFVPADARYEDVEIVSDDAVIFSETTSSSGEKLAWCQITRNLAHASATIRNLSPNVITVDGASVGVGEVLDIKTGSQIVSGPESEGYLLYTFEVISSVKPGSRSLKISLDVEHAKCSICLNIWHDVVTVSPCFHNFCNGCFSEWLRRASTRSRATPPNIVCPQCRAVVHSVGRNHFLHNIEETILQTFSSLKRSDEEIVLLDSYASIKSNLVLGIQKKSSRKRPLSHSMDYIVDLPCPQCGTELAGFQCNRNTVHLQCHRCGGMMPSRPEIGVPQRCLGCDKAFCGAYWLAQGVDTTDVDIICCPETFKPIVDYTISRIPDSVHQNNRYEKEITAKCIHQTGKTLQAAITEWIIKLSNKEIDRSRLQLNHAELISARTHLCSDCYDKLVGFLLYWFRVSLPRHLLPPEASQREDCWYGYTCHTQHHSHEHAKKRNHVCCPTRGNVNASL